MASRQSRLRLGRAVRAQFVGHQHIGREALFLEQLAHQFHGCSLVAPSLHQEIENLAFIVDRAPEPEPPARNRHGHLVEMPPRRWPWASVAKFAGEQRPEFQDPSPHRFVGDIQSTLSEQIFDVAITEGETNIEPNRMSDDRRGNWWRANEIVMRHLTRRLETRYRCRDKATKAPRSRDERADIEHDAGDEGRS